MTKEEAKKRFGLKDTDPIYKPGVKELMKGFQSQLKVWSIPKYEKDIIEKDIEACKALLEE